MDRATDRPAGTGFVAFFNEDDFKNCLKGAPRQQPVPTLSKHSVLQDERVDPEGKYTLEGRVLSVTEAVSKEDATRLTTEGVGARKAAQEKDKRRLYLLSEGTITPSSPMFKFLSQAEVKMREQSANQRKKLIQSNPSLHLSLTRLALRNIPRNMGAKELKALAREAIVGFASDVKEGKRQPLSKEENARGGEQDREAERQRKLKGKGVVKQAKIVFESNTGSKVDEKTGAGKSRGYGFIEYYTHRAALMALRWLNGHALKNEAGKTQRLIVEFAIENAQVVQRRRAMENKYQANQKEQAKAGVSKGDKGSKFGKDSKGKAGKDGGVKDAGKVEDHIDVDKKNKKKAEEKLALRTKIIARKRQMRKKKSSSRGKK